MSYEKLVLTKNTNQKDILIIDDTADNLRVLSSILTNQGYGVRKALNWHMALMACKTVLPDLILLDIMMPEVNGYEVCQRLKALDVTANIPIIFMSALDDVFDKVKAFSVGGVDYITKPFELEELLVRVQNQLILRTAQQEILKLNTELEHKVQERTRELEKSVKKLQQEMKRRKHLQSKLLNMAWHDPLTKLPNRTLFLKKLEQALQRAKLESGYGFAILFLDCDRFKIINDSLGHFVGDELLVAIARRLQASLNFKDTLARFGGDEFAILLEDITDISMAIGTADKILHQLSVAFQLSRHEVFINASIGITWGETCYEEPEYLLRDADTAMYRAKALGKARYHVFDPVMHQEAIQRLQLEHDLRIAIERQEFFVQYQPIISLKTGNISGFEALVRWQHPTKGLIPPTVFVPIAEETGLIGSIDTWVLQSACHQLRIWQERLKTGTFLTMSVNLSAALFSYLDIVSSVDKILNETQIDPACLQLEITESVIMENTETLKIILQQLKERKIRLVMDDFGTGYSSLSYLHRFPFYALKIDKSFVNRMQENQEDMGLVPATIGIAHSMGMKAIAEGVETPKQLALLRRSNCDLAQGYLFSKAVDADLALDLIAAVPQW
jgi:diguanylate cyclase (GGDEF)-like protein